VVLKLKTGDFRTFTRHLRLSGPTRLPDLLFEAARTLLAKEAGGTAYRLIGIGASPLLPGELADQPDLADPKAPRRIAAQDAIDALRGRFGAAVIGRGRGLAQPMPASTASGASGRVARPPRSGRQ
jgi:DNA polymerase-4